MHGPGVQGSGILNVIATEVGGGWVGESITGSLSHFSGHVVSTLHCQPCSLPLPTFCYHRGMKEIKQDATVPSLSLHADRWPTFDRCNNDYITAFHLASWPPVKDSQPWTFFLHDTECLLNARRRVTITYRRTYATDSPMFSLAPMLPMSNIRCIHQPNSIKNCSCECSYNCAQPWYTIQHRTVLVIIITAQTMTIGSERKKVWETI